VIRFNISVSYADGSAAATVAGPPDLVAFLFYTSAAAHDMQGEADLGSASPSEHKQTGITEIKHLQHGR